MQPCSDNQKYSSRVAPLQSPFPLLPGAVKIRHKQQYTRRITILINEFYKQNMTKEKKYQKKKENRKWAAPIVFFVRF
jgi:hypothetical protein